MEFHIGMGRSETIHEIGPLARIAEDAGFTHINFPDQPPLNRDVFLNMAMAAQSTTKILMGPGIVTPYTYHPAVIANATATVDELSGGRAFVGIGAGGSAVMSMGLKPRPMSELREAARFIKNFMSGKEAEFKGGKTHSEWIKRPVPMYIAIDGPRGHEIAGEFADGVYVQSVHPDVFEWRKSLIERSAVKAGRDPSKIKIIPSTIVYITDDRESARREVAPQVASKLRRAFPMWRSSHPDMVALREQLEKNDPGLVDELIQVGDRINEVFDEHQHEKMDSPQAEPVTWRLIDYYMLVGSEDEVCERIQDLRNRGLAGLMPLIYTIQDKQTMMQEIGARIISRFGNN